jgi:hypothetical protein
MLGRKDGTAVAATPAAYKALAVPLLRLGSAAQ